MSDWASLPLEIGAEILTQLTNHDEPIAQYAVVSSRWRRFIEKKTFRHLELHHSDILALGRLSEHSKGLIQHIWLNIELYKYGCPACCQLESSAYYCYNNSLMADAITQLFSILTNFPQKKTEDGGQGNLTLELNAYSLSDKRHWFQNCYFGAPDEDEDELDSLEVIHDPCYGWWHNHRTRIPSAALRRPFETATLNFQQQLPPVPAVTRFILRRQCRRQLEPSQLSYIWSLLPRLQEIRYEPWQLPDMAFQDKRDQAFAAILGDQLPKGVKIVTIFEDFNESYLDTFRASQGRDADLHEDRDRTETPPISAAFARHSQKLENLSLAFLLDAREFFDACEQQPHWRWDQLRSIKLTSRVMNKNDSVLVSGLIETAGRVALRMPKLETMTLWNGARGEACAFTWFRDGALLTWRGNFDIQLQLEHSVLAAWWKVAYEYARHELKVKTKVFEHTIRSHGDAVHYLGLRSVVDGVSLRQIRKENNFEEEKE